MNITHPSQNDTLYKEYTKRSCYGDFRNQISQNNTADFQCRFKIVEV